MNKKKISVFLPSATPILVLITIGFASLNLISCGADEAETDSGTNQLTAEEQKDLARFVEYVFFSTAPYVDKSWVETDVPEDEVVENLIDFATETAAIQQVYTEVYNAYNARNTKAVLANFDPYGLEVQRRCVDPPGPGEDTTVRALSKAHLERLLNASCHELDARIPGFGAWGPSPLLTEFYIRRANVLAPWPEASAKGFNSISGTSKVPGVTYVYLVKKQGKWFINQLVTDHNVIENPLTDYRGKPPISKYFDDPKYKAPE